MVKLRRVLALTGLAACIALQATAQAPHDGAHDFDFARGSWHTHVTRILDPFAGGTHTRTMDGTKVARPVWAGRGWLEEIEADGSAGHWEGATLFLYNPKSGQWSQTYLDSDGGEVGTPEIGAFKDGRGEFFSTGDYQGRTVLKRGVWSGITADSHSYEIDYSRDGGRTWVAAFKADLTRLK